MSTKKVLADSPGLASGEFDVKFGERELGMRLEERGSFKMLSVVSKVTEGGERVSMVASSVPIPWVVVSFRE